MAYGIGLVFDPQTEAHIREVWCTLARQGFATPLARPGCLPHVSLILSETLRVDDLARDLDGLGHSPRRLEVRILARGRVYRAGNRALLWPDAHRQVAALPRRRGTDLSPVELWHYGALSIRGVGAALHVSGAGGSQSVIRSHRRRGHTDPAMGCEPGAAGDCPVRPSTRGTVESLPVAGITRSPPHVSCPPSRWWSLRSPRCVTAAAQVPRPQSPQ